MLTKPHVSVTGYDESKEELWITCRNKLRNTCRNDPLFENYNELVPEHFLYFNMAIIDNQIAAFGAVEKQPKKWGRNLARTLTRFWIDPDYRTKHLTKWDDKHIRFSPLLLADQLQFLDTQDDILVAMITREGNYKNSFKEIIRLANTASEYSFLIQEGKHNICSPGSNDSDSCKQMIALAQIKHLNVDKYLSIVNEAGMLLKVE